MVPTAASETSLPSASVLEVAAGPAEAVVSASAFSSAFLPVAACGLGVSCAAGRFFGSSCAFGCSSPLDSSFLSSSGTGAGVIGSLPPFSRLTPPYVTAPRKDQFTESLADTWYRVSACRAWTVGIGSAFPPFRCEKPLPLT